MRRNDVGLGILQQKQEKVGDNWLKRPFLTVFYSFFVLLKQFLWLLKIRVPSLFGNALIFNGLKCLWSILLIVERNMKCS